MGACRATAAVELCPVGGLQPGSSLGEALEVRAATHADTHTDTPYTHMELQDLVRGAL